MTAEQLDELANLMAYGVAEQVADKITGKAYPPYAALPSWVAADAIGVRRARARAAISTPAFRRAYARALDSLRNGERARNLATAIRIRDEPLQDETAADRAVKLKAIASIEGRDAPEYNLTLNQTALVADLGHRMRCTACGRRTISTQPGPPRR
jgi:hypothetical protein